VALGLARAEPASLRGGSPAENAALAVEVLSGRGGAQGDLVALNAAAALVVAGIATDLHDGLERAFASLHAGAGAAALEALVEASSRARRDEGS
jgi:anthranilate phosphoribosyltransferase